MIVDVKKDVAYFDVGNVIADSDSYEDYYGLYAMDDYDYDYGPRPLNLLETIQYFIDIGMTNERLIRINRLAEKMIADQCQYEFALLWMLTDSRFPIESIIVRGSKDQLFEVVTLQDSCFSVEPVRLGDNTSNKYEER